MVKLYGDSLRKEAGFIKVIKGVATRNARIFESRAGMHAPEISRVYKEVKGGFDKVFDETKDVVEEFGGQVDTLRRVSLDASRDDFSLEGPEDNHAEFYIDIHVACAKSNHSVRSLQQIPQAHT